MLVLAVITMDRLSRVSSYLSPPISALNVDFVGNRSSSNFNGNWLLLFRTLQAFRDILDPASYL